MINDQSTLKEQLAFLESRGLKRLACKTLANAVLEDFKVKNKKLLDALTEEILRTNRVPDIRLYWDSKTEDLKFEVVE